MATRTTALIRRPALVAALLLLTAMMPAGLHAANRAPAASGPNTWAPTGSMTVGRAGHTATLLPSGQVLIAGGVHHCTRRFGCGVLSSAELYDPSTGAFTTTGSMTVGRAGHTATLLANGKVLVAGGDIGATAELYDPSTGTWTATGTMTTFHNGGQSATLLPNGQVLVAGGYAIGGYLAAAELYDPNTGTWATTGSMNSARTTHTATLLPNGLVLVAGGCCSSTYPYGPFTSTELYDPATGTWTFTGSMTTAREEHTATLLNDGQVLVAGGQDNQGNAFTSAELYDPSAGTWTATGSMAAARYGHTANLLDTGLVLVAGGDSCYSGCPLASSELYDPNAGTWTSVGSMGNYRAGDTATVLSSGQVLVAGGDTTDCSMRCTATATAALFTPGASPFVQLSSSSLTFSGQLVGTTSPAQTLTITNTGTVSLNVSSVAISGAKAASYADSTTCTAAPIPPSGACTVAVQFAPLITGTVAATLTLTDNAPLSPQKVMLQGSGGGPNAWATTGAMIMGPILHTATLLPDGKVLMAGGESPVNNPIANAELYDPSTNTWSATGNMTTPREYHAATLLTTGEVLVAGGDNYAEGILSSAELYNPATGTWTPTGSMTNSRLRYTLTLLPNGQALAAGPDASAELYNPATGTWTPTGSMTTSRTYQTATLLRSGQVLVAGGQDQYTNPLSSTELYDPPTGTWSATGSMTKARYGQTATLLDTGNVLVVGGSSSAATTSAESYNPLTKTWTSANPMPAWRVYFTAAPLSTGKVLVTGGEGPGKADSFLYDPASGTWARTASLGSGRPWSVATLLTTGDVLLSGGCCATSGLLAGAELYTPALVGANPSSGSYGQTLVVTGTNFYAHETVNIYPDSTGNPPLYTATTDGSGSFVLTDTVRQGTYGVHILIAVGQSSGGTTSTPFTVQPLLTLSPTSGTSGATVTATGYGFGASEQVALHWGRPTGPLLGTATSNAYGTFANAGAFTFTVPAGATPGRYQVYAIGQTSGAQAVASFKVS